MSAYFKWVFILLGVNLFLSCSSINDIEKIPLESGNTIALVGNNLCSRMINYGHFETEMYLRYPEKKLLIRNLCDGGDTPGFRPHSSRKSPWAFPGAENFYQNEFANNSNSVGDYPTPDEWLTLIKADVILAFFGYNESFRGADGLDNYKEELSAFIDHTLAQNYNGKSAPELVLISPVFFEDLSESFDYPNGVEINERLLDYTLAMSDVAHLKNIRFVDIFQISKKWSDYTQDGFQLNDHGYNELGEYLAKTIFADGSRQRNHETLVANAVEEKNWFWENDYKIPNGVHVYGRRHKPFGVDNYPEEIEKIRQMTSIRDSAIWVAASEGQTLDIASLDAQTRTLTEIETNYNPDNLEDQAYKYGDEFLETFTMAPGYKIDIFASEKEFPDLANPCQMSFDDQGRLWVAVMPSYPHYKPGDSKPNDKLLILEDTDKDGKADKQIIFADSLHIPVGFEITPQGVYVSQGTNFKLYIDHDGDDRADEEKIILSGFDDHDTHHTVGAFCADPMGGIYLSEGVFLHTGVETAYGPVRGTNGGFYRYNPTRNELERTANMSIPNPWGTAFDEWGQNFFLHTSGPNVNWMMPTTVLPRYGIRTPLTKSIIEDAHRVRPTSGLEFISSRHFPDDVQGDMLLNNTIGFLGTKQHEMIEDGTGYYTKHKQDLLRSTDGNFRPVDLEFAPDGSLYIVDWHNILVGHMQHSARDPLRDHVHGRVLRVTYPERPLVEPAKVHGASIEELFSNLGLPEYRTRYRSRRALRGRDVDEVYNYLQDWKKENDEEKLLLEGLWVSAGMNNVDVDLLEQLLNADDYHVRAAAVRVLRYSRHQVDGAKDLFMAAAADENGRVRLEALVSATWLDPIDGNEILDEIENHDVDEWMESSLKYGRAHLNDRNYDKEEEAKLKVNLKGEELASYRRGQKIYERDGSCATCHQEDGNGLAQSGFPPLKNSEWVLKDEEVLIKLTLKGIYGPITVDGKDYPGQVPMPPYEKMLNDQELADVLSYVRNAFGNEAATIDPKEIAFIREATSDKKSYYTPEELLRVYSIQ